ncbi:hemolymph lipopolysaccharide-binding protein [Anabrus simplex]|uniref:hemolymph lipopolysaccharide-binding protein n=1 Tax=Anabrus simplex TaxID=316456 RepID=UPI0035A27544
MTLLHPFLLSVCLAATLANQCDRSADVSFSVSSRKNLTGHRLITAEVRSEEAVTLAVDQLKEKCGTTSAVILRASAISNDSSTLPIIPSALGPRGSSPPADYEFFDGLGYYKFHTDPVTWLDAVIICAKEGGHLLVLNSEREADVVRKFFARKPDIFGADYTDYLQIGFHDLYHEGQYTTITGETLSSSGYTRWASGQPNANRNQNCATINTRAELFDDVCNWRMAYICEFPAQCCRARKP